MSTTTSIEWAANVDGTPGRSWNCVRGCSRVSPGCGGAAGVGGCYAEVIAGRFSDEGQPFHGYAERTKQGARWTGKVDLLPERLADPLRWRGALTPGAGLRCFANSTSDLFHEKLPNEHVAAMFGVMSACPGVTFIALTKRASRLPDFAEWLMETASTGIAISPEEYARVCAIRILESSDQANMAERLQRQPLQGWPLPNLILGVSTERQRELDDRVPPLLRSGLAPVYAISAEPLLEGLHLDNGETSYLTCGGCDGDENACATAAAGNRHFHGVGWVVVGGESGPGARPFNVAWARSVIRQCREAGVACFTKQIGANVITRNDDCLVGDRDDDPPGWDLQPEQVEHDIDWTRDGYQGAPVRIHLRDRKGGDPAEWPADIRVRQWPANLRWEA